MLSQRNGDQMKHTGDWEQVKQAVGLNEFLADFKKAPDVSGFFLIAITGDGGVFGVSASQIGYAKMLEEKVAEKLAQIRMASVMGAKELN